MPQAGGPPQAGGAADACMKGFVPLREEAEKRGKLIKAASDRKAPPEEACKLITNFVQAEMKMMNMSRPIRQCGIPAQIPNQLKNGQDTPRRCRPRSAALRSSAAGAGQAAASLSEVLGSSALPEARPSRRAAAPSIR